MTDPTHDEAIATVTTILGAQIIAETTRKPTVTFESDDGLYRITFRYHREAVKLIKAAVPSYARTFDPDTKRWSVRTQWAGALAFAFRGAGFGVNGLNEKDIEDWFAPFATAVPTSKAGHRAYLKGMCKTCKTSPHPPGCVECQDCFHRRLVRQYHVTRVLAEAGLAPWPQVQPARGSAWDTHAPIPDR
jgi:hypothetical protein